MLDLNEMAMFAEVVEAKSFTQAAENLGVPISTLSRRLNQLEQRLNVRLLQRTTRKLQLTEVGSTYFIHCKRMLEEAEQAEQAVRQLQSEPTGTIRITAPFGFDDRYASELLSSYLKECPKIKLELVQTTRNVDLIEERFDCAIRMGKQSDSTLVARSLGTVDLILCASPQYLEQDGIPESLEDLERFNGIGLELLDWSWLEDPRFQSINAQFRVKTNDLIMARQFTLDGCGICLLPVIHCQSYLESGRLVQILPELSYQLPIYLVYPGQRQVSTKLRSFIDHQVAMFEQSAPWDFHE